jgi:hypothetical protein
MHIPAHFYYNTPLNEGSHFGMTPSGVLSVSRLLKNSPYWQKPYERFDKKPKTLILHITRDTSLTNVKLKILSIRLNDLLMEHGFRLYLWCNSCVIPFNKDGLLIKDLPRPPSTEKSSDEIIAITAAKQLSLTYDEVLVLNEDALNTFILGGEGDWPEDTDFRVVKFNHDCLSTESLDHLLNKKYTLIESLNISGCVNLTSSTLSTQPILSHLNELTIGMDSNIIIQEDFILSKDAIIQLIQRAPQLASFYFYGNHYTPDEVKSILQHLPKKTLTSLHLYEVRCLNSLFFHKDAPLKVFYASHCEFKEETAAEVSTINMSSLEVLELEHTVCPSELVNQWLSSAKNLTKLQISYNSPQPNPIALQQHELKSLQELSLANVQIEPDALYLLLASAPHLNQLTLQSCSIARERQSLTLPALQYLSLITVVLSTALLESMLVSELRTLNLKDVKLEHEITRSLMLKNLESVSINNMMLSTHSLERMLTNAHGLTELTLQHLTLNEHLNITICFTKLVTIDLSHTKLTNKSFERIISLAPTLKTLLLEGCTLIGELQTPLALNTLETIDMNRGAFGATSMMYLLKHASQLKTLSWTDIQSLEGNITQPLLLTSLEELSISTNALNPLSLQAVSLQNLIIHGNKLKKLTIGRLNIQGDITQDIVLGALEEIKIKDCTLTAKSLEHLLHGAVCLKKIELDNCDIQGEMAKNLSLNQLEKIDIINCTTKMIEEILAHLLMKNLKSFTIVDHDSQNETDINSYIKKLTLDHIEVIDLSIPINNSSLQHLLMAPNLNYLELLLDSDVDIPANDEAWGIKNLKILSLTLKSGSLSASFLQQLFMHAPLLNQLILTSPNSKWYIDENITQNLNLEALRWIEFNNITIDARVLANLLIYAPQLNNLEGDNLDIIDGNVLDYLEPALLDKDILSLLSLWNSDDSDQPINTGKTNLFLRNKPVRANNECTIDADTTDDPNEQLITNKYFYASNSQLNTSPSPAIYRLNVMNSLLVNSARSRIDQPFKLSNIGELSLVDHEVKKSERDLFSSLSRLPEVIHTQYYGRIALALSPEWQALPSLSSQERMTHYHLDIPNVYVELLYSLRDNLYYIRSNVSYAQPVTIDFLVNIPKQDLRLPDDIEKLALVYKKFGNNALKVSKKEKMTGNDYLRALEEQKVGACRHRSVAFKAKMQEIHPEIPVRLVGNHCHMFAEVWVNTHWICCDLGGYPAELKIQEPSPPPSVADDPWHGLQPTSMSLDAQGNVVLSSPRHYFIQPIHAQSKPTSAQQYLFQRLQHLTKSMLLKCSHTESVKGAAYHLQALCQHTSRPCFYIDSPEDLICSSTWIEQDDANQGTIRRGPGGPLYAFLKEHATDDNHPLLIVNYNHFTTNDMVRFNSLLDKNPRADGTDLPSNTMVIGIMNPDEPGAYTGLDFFSRFNTKETVPEELQAQLTVPELSIPMATCHAEELMLSQTINLYSSAQWEERLLGHWILQGKQLHFVDGELVAALKKKKTHININNGPWQNQQFLRFWQMAALTKHINCAGKIYDLPDDFILTQSNQIDLTKATRLIKVEQEVTPLNRLYVLNPTTLPQFFNQYVCNNEEQAIYQKQGYLADNAEGTLHVYLSHAITTNAWSELLDNCETHAVQLKLIVAPGIQLPAAMCLEMPIRARQLRGPWSKKAKELENKVVYIESADSDVTLAFIEADEVIDVSEVEAGNLLTKMNGALSESSLCFEFNKQEGALLNAMADGKTIVLKGQFSEELLHLLSQEIINQEQSSTTGHLILISDKPDLFLDLNSLKHAPSLAEKKDCLEERFGTDAVANLSDSNIIDYSLAELISILRYKIIHPKSTELKQTWLGMETLPTPPNVLHHGGINFREAETIVQTFNKQRKEAVEQGLLQAPFVFLAGMTGVGKTTFIEKVWQQTYPAVYFGENALQAWAKDTSEGIKTLFIDEANISSRQWTEFEGLFNPRPGIMIDNQYVELTSEHKVIFAGNPISYGAGRHLPELFRRHGGSVVFDPMPPEYIYHEILKPIYENIDITEGELENASQHILHVAQYLTQISHDHVLISARELAMMALLALNYCRNNQQVSLADATAVYAYTISLNLVPETKRDEFNRIYFQNQLPNSIKISDFYVSPNYFAAYNTINDFLSLREHRRESLWLNSVQSHGGLGGIILEGEPGIGKSELVIATLVARGYQQEHDVTNASKQDNMFYIIPPSMPLEAKKSVLLKAFYEGAVVIIDEINSSSMMERFLNDLLMGKAPNERAIEGKGLGFMVIGTQNPTTMAGRHRPSLALQRRMQTITIAAPNTEEMLHIICIEKKLPFETARAMIIEYQDIIQQAKQRHLPAPLCFRDLIKRADWEARSINAASSITPQIIDINWVQLINEPIKYVGNHHVKNTTHALMNIYLNAPSQYHSMIKKALQSFTNNEPEAWLALAMIAHLDGDEAARESSIEHLSAYKAKRPKSTDSKSIFFKKQFTTESLQHALSHGMLLDQDIRGINAFILAYSEEIYKTLSLVQTKGYPTNDSL